MEALEFAQRHRWALTGVAVVLVAAEVVAAVVLGTWAFTLATVGVVAAATVTVRCVVATGGELR